MPTILDEEYVKLWEAVNAKQETILKEAVAQIEKTPKAQWNKQQRALHSALMLALEDIDPELT